eukprot:10665341-Lingulodinium_polyedra.AAC.1
MGLGSGGPKRVFSPPPTDGSWPLGITGQNQNTAENTAIDNDINFLRGCTLQHELQGRRLARDRILQTKED